MTPLVHGSRPFMKRSQTTSLVSFPDLPFLDSCHTGYLTFLEHITTTIATYWVPAMCYTLFLMLHCYHHIPSTTSLLRFLYLACPSPLSLSENILLILYATVQMSSSEESLALSQIKLIAPLLSSQSTLCKVDIMLLLCLPLSFPRPWIIHLLWHLHRQEFRPGKKNE